MDEQKDQKPEEQANETGPVEVTELEDNELESAAGGQAGSIVPVEDGNCHNTQCCG
jgi:hypothetical protein